MNSNNFLLFGTARHSFTFTALKSDLENVSKSTKSLNKGSISRNGNAVQVRFAGAPHVPYSVPTAGLLVAQSAYGLTAGSTVRAYSMFVNKGDKVFTGDAGQGETISAYILPLKIS